MPDDARRELILLGLWYRARHSQGFRRHDEKIIGSTIDEVTGLERSEADLRAPGDAIRGPQFVFECPVQPDRLPEETLKRDEWDGSTPSLGEVRGVVIVTQQPDLADEAAGLKGTFKEVIVGRYPTNERGRADEELLHIQRHHPEWKAKLREVQGRSAWTEEESEAFAEMKYRWQLTLLDFSRQGFVRLEPPLKFMSDTGNNEMYASGVDQQGLPYIATVTAAGLEEAERRIRDDPIYSKGAFSSVASMTGERQAAVMTRNPWAHKKYLMEDGAGA